MKRILINWLTGLGLGLWVLACNPNTPAPSPGDVLNAHESVCDTYAALGAPKYAKVNRVDLSAALEALKASCEAREALCRSAAPTPSASADAGVDQ